MDISRVRKKIKKSRERDKQKAAEPAEKQRSDEADAGAVKDSEITGAKPSGSVGTDSAAGLEKKDAEKTEKSVKAGLPGVEAETKSVPVSETEILAFKVADEEYAVKIDDLQEILKIQRISAVPRSPKYLKGITSVRGKILPVIDLKERLRLTEENAGKEKIIILSGKKEPLGVLVGEILGVFRFSEEELLPPPSTLTDEGKNFIDGIVRINSKFISVLKVDEILKMEVL